MTECLVGVLLSVWTSSCASPVVISEIFVSSGNWPEIRTRPECALRITEITDQRMDSSTFGMVAGRPVRAPADQQAWLRSVLLELAKHGIAVSFGTDAPAAGLSARVELKKAWVGGISTSKTSSVVIGLRYARGGAEIKAADYRGSVSSVDWAAGAEEIEDMLGEALDQTLIQIATDTAQLCGVPPPSGKL